MPHSKQHASDARRRAKRADVRHEHADRYADRRVDPDDRRMAELLADLAARFNGEDGHRA